MSEKCWKCFVSDYVTVKPKLQIHFRTRRFFFISQNWVTCSKSNFYFTNRQHIFISPNYTFNIQPKIISKNIKNKIFFIVCQLTPLFVCVTPSKIQPHLIQQFFHITWHTLCQNKFWKTKQWTYFNNLFKLNLIFHFESKFDTEKLFYEIFEICYWLTSILKSMQFRHLSYRLLKSPQCSFRTFTNQRNLQQLNSFHVYKLNLSAHLEIFCSNIFWHWVILLSISNSKIWQPTNFTQKIIHQPDV